MPENKITIMALGGAGCRIMKKFSTLTAAEKFRLIAVDSDLESLRDSGVREK